MACRTRDTAWRTMIRAVLLVSPQDVGGGAERAATQLRRAIDARGIDARLLVTYRRSSDPGVFEAVEVPGRGPIQSSLRALHTFLGRRPHFRGRDSLRRAISLAAAPQSLVDRLRGREQSSYLPTRSLHRMHGWTADVVHLHNLHGAAFDIRLLRHLSQSVPVVWTLHDAWAVTGHCAYFIDCDRWRSGCGKCPDLKRAPGLISDGTRWNWATKREALRSSNVQLACPSRWLARVVAEAEPTLPQPVVIPLGVDFDVFHPRDRTGARIAHGLPLDRFLCLVVATSGTSANPYKDGGMILDVANLMWAAEGERSPLFIVIGGGPARSTTENPNVVQLGRISSRDKIASIYSAADVFLHAAHADNYPYTVLEAAASGTPSVATDVGGVGEQVDDGVTGWLVPRGDRQAMVARINDTRRLVDERIRMGEAATRRVRERNALNKETDAYLELYEALIRDRQSPADANRGTPAHRYS